MSESKNFDPKSLDDLLAKVAASQGPDVSLDGELALLGGWTFSKSLRDAKPYWRKPGAQEWYQREDGPPRYTASIDAALALVERVLPGWMVVNLCEWDADALRARGPWNCTLKKLGTQDHFLADAGRCHHAPTPALALVQALLFSLKAST